MGGWVVPLLARKAVEPSVSGGKGAGLARLIRAGFPVPPGFIIGTAAVREPLALALRSSGQVPGGKPGGSRGTSDAPDRPDLEAARRVCLEWAIPVRLRRAILRAYRRLGSGPVAVRSSLVGEDAAVSSFAGQLESVLEVRGESALLDAFRRVLASAFSDRLWDYLRPSEARPGPEPPAPAAPIRPDPPGPAARPDPRRRQAPDRGVSLSLAVVVQSMVRAEVSGVAFSADPVSGSPSVVIEAVPGLGEALVRGRASPDRYRLDPRGEVCEVEPARAGVSLLREPQARTLGALVHAIASFVGAPQDVEWSFDGCRFHILQARPISSLTGRQVYSRRMVSDMAPGVVKPLVWSAKYAPIVANVFAPVFEELVGQAGLDYSRLVARLHSHVYMNITAFGEIFKRLGLPSNFFYVLAREDKAARSMFQFRLGRLPALVRHIRFIRRESRIGRRVDPFLAARHRQLDEFRTLDWSAPGPEGLLGRFERLKALHGKSQWYIVVVSVNMLIRNRLLGRMIVRRWPGTDPRDVIKGYGRRSSLAPFEELRGMAADARRLGRGFVERLAGPEDLDVAAALAALPAGSAGAGLSGRFDRFMARYGFLSANGSDFSETPWIENPRAIWRTVGRLALHPDAGPSPAQAEARRDEVLGLVRKGFGPLRRCAFDRLHASTVRYMECRERVSLLMTEESYWMRRCLLALGAKLVAGGVLGETSDVFYLFEDELAGLVREPGEAAPAAGRVAARKAEIERDAAFDPPETLCDGELGRVEPRPAAAAEFLSGIGASAGVFEGRARVVLDPALSHDHLGPGDVLVVPFTDVGWTPILASVGAIVAESGGQLSHTSIIAREYGIPAVVSVRNATRLIADGATVTVDGTSGRIHLRRDGPGPGTPAGSGGRLSP
jgi:phosphohistidine swiveling domain-containing protein